MRALVVVAVLLALMQLVACASALGPGEPRSTDPVELPPNQGPTAPAAAEFLDETTVLRTLPALCEVVVDGYGSFPVEGNNGYLARVLACEHYSAEDEALRALAVSARTYLYFMTGGTKRTSSTQRLQVSICSELPTEAHNAAVRSTSGQVILHGGEVICGFHVAGAVPSTRSCIPVRGGRRADSDRFNTEWAITYNACKVADAVRPTGIGNYSNRHNRGCLSQNGANCLADRGESYHEILRFYYGDDIQVGQAFGGCVDTSGSTGHCGDGTCELGESCQRCPADCGPCSSECPSDEPGLVVHGRCVGRSGQCLEVIDCPDATHLPVSGHCPGKSSNIRCCVPAE